MHPAQVLEVCQEVTELDLTDWKSRIEGKGGAEVPEVKFLHIVHPKQKKGGAEVLPEVKFFLHHSS